MNHEPEKTTSDDESNSKSVHPLLRKEKPKRKPEVILMEAVGFSEDDLKANQTGQISKDQRRKLAARRNIWLIGIIVQGCILVMLWYGTSINFLIVVVLGSIFYSCHKLLILHRDLLGGQANNLEGRISLDVNGQFYSLRIENVQFALKKNAFLAFKNGDPYRIFYTPNRKWLLSAEWLRDQD